jgi:predicted transport protein
MIFESMNSTGKALTQADLIRNFVLMGLDHEMQTRLYNDYWRPMEVAFGADNYINQFDEFMRYFLVIHTGNHRIRKDEVYDEFKAYSRDLDVEALLGKLKEFTTYYCDMALGRGQDKELSTAFHDIRELRADVCYPLLMEVYQDYKNSHIAKEEFLEIIRMVESYVFRRAVCDIPTNSLRQTFATFGRRLKKDRYLESVKATFLLLQSYRRFPGESEFALRIKERNLYNFNRRSYWLRRMENHGRKERVYVQDYTIEHILPQNDNLSSEWKTMLGPEWEQVHETYLHTLGNLTLTGYNSELSDRPFLEKRDMDGGFGDSPLRLNKGLGSLQKWDEDEIKARADKLAGKAVFVWGEPTLDTSILDAYREKTPETGYGIDDHKHLLEGKNRELFEAFRKEVLALDPCVSEEFLKLYVAYKAETNFVDIVPQASRLRLSLNMRFHEIDDPHGLCDDVTGLGRWGNGDIQVSLSELDQLPAVIGLIRQSLEMQLGDGDD